MSVTVTSPISAGYVPNGATRAFAFNFKIATTAEIAVYQVLAGVATLIDPGVYIVTLDPDGEGGTVTFTAAPAAGTGTIYLLSAPLLTQTLALANDRPFTPSILNGALDRAAIRAVFLNFQVARTIRVPIGETGSVLPSVAQRAGKVPAFDLAGDIYTPNVSAADLEVLAGIAAQIAVVALNIAAVLDAPNQATLAINAKVAAQAAQAAAAASAASIVDLSAVNWSLVSGGTLTSMFNAMKTAGLFDGFLGV